MPEVGQVGARWDQGVAEARGERFGSSCCCVASRSAFRLDSTSALPIPTLGERGVNSPLHTSASLLRQWDLVTLVAAYYSDTNLAPFHYRALASGIVECFSSASLHFLPPFLPFFEPAPLFRTLPALFIASSNLFASAITSSQSPSSTIASISPGRGVAP